MVIHLLTTRFDNNTWQENCYYREKNGMGGCIYGSATKIKEKIPLGDLIRTAFEAEFKNTTGVTTVRNAGLMIGIELDRPCGDLVKMALSAKLLINVTADNVVRLLPPLVMNESEAKELVQRLAVVIKTFLNS